MKFDDNIDKSNPETFEIVFCLDGPLYAHRRIVEAGATEVVWPDLGSGKYVRTEEMVATEPGFMYVAEDEEVEDVRKRHLTGRPSWATIVDRREKRDGRTGTGQERPEDTSTP